MVATESTHDAETDETSSESLQQSLDAFLRRKRSKGMLRGFAAGGVATVVMTCFRAPISRSPPPPAWLWRKYVADDDDDNPDRTVVASAVLHLLYGIVAGGVFGAIVGSRGGHTNGDEKPSTAFGLLYGVVLSAFGDVVLLQWLLRLDLDAGERFIFHVGHVVYGLALGAWFGSVE